MRACWPPLTSRSTRKIPSAPFGACRPCCLACSRAAPCNCSRRHCGSGARMQVCCFWRWRVPGWARGSCAAPGGRARCARCAGCGAARGGWRWRWARLRRLPAWGCAPQPTRATPWRLRSKGTMCASRAWSRPCRRSATWGCVCALQSNPRSLRARPCSCRLCSKSAGGARACSTHPKAARSKTPSRVRCRARAPRQRSPRASAGPMTLRRQGPARRAQPLRLRYRALVLGAGRAGHGLRAHGAAR